MPTVRIAAISTASLLVLTLSAAAQMMGPGMMGPGMMGPGMGSAPPPPQQQQMPPCMRDFLPLRTEAEKRANSLKSVMEKKPSREEACSSFKHFSAAEARVVKYIAENGQSCGVPPEAAKAMKANHMKTLKVQKQICEGGGMAGPAKPSGPGLSEALGTNRPIGANDSGAPQSGTLNTLSGNVLQR